MSEKTALVVMVHGSPMPIANADMFKVVEIVRSRNAFGKVIVGFMECNEPTIPEAIQECVDAGCKSVVAVPYFLHVGTHVADDLPTILEEARRNNPTVEFALGSYIGASQSVTEILRHRVLET